MVKGISTGLMLSSVLLSSGFGLKSWFKVPSGYNEGKGGYSMLNKALYMDLNKAEGHGMKN